MRALRRYLLHLRMVSAQQPWKERKGQDDEKITNQTDCATKSLDPAERAEGCTSSRVKIAVSCTQLPGVAGRPLC